MNDLASHIFNAACAMNRAKLSEINNAILQKDLRGDDQSPKGRWDTPQELVCCDCRTITGAAQAPDIAPHIAKIPLRAEVRDMLIAAKLYDEHADLLKNGAELHEHYAEANRAEAARLEKMARDARAQSENLERMAGL